MSEARRDPLSGRWVVVAPGRSHRPDTFGTGGEAGPDGCPFCPGHEHHTPPEITRVGQGPPDRPGWEIRVFPNRFPIVGGSPSPAAPGAGEDPLRQGSPATGAHEVVVFSPDHRRTLGDLDPARVVAVLEVLRDRAQAHRAEGRSAVPIVNQGPAGGASVAHPHAQVIAGDVEPAALLAEADRLAAGGRCALCAEIERHRTEPDLVVGCAEAELWCPWWSGSAYEMLLAPHLHRPRFEDAADELPAVGHLLRDGLARLRRLLGDSAYNLVVHSLPVGSVNDFHWHVHVWPRLQRDGGFERGTGVLVDVVDPAEAAAALRHA